MFNSITSTSIEKFAVIYHFKVLTFVTFAHIYFLITVSFCFNGYKYLGWACKSIENQIPFLVKFLKRILQVGMAL